MRNEPTAVLGHQGPAPQAIVVEFHATDQTIFRHHTPWSECMAAAVQICLIPYGKATSEGICIAFPFLSQTLAHQLFDCFPTCLQVSALPSVECFGKYEQGTYDG